MQFKTVQSDRYKHTLVYFKIIFILCNAYGNFALIKVMIQHLTVILSNNWIFRDL